MMGIKVWSLVDANGFIVGFKIYTGSKGNNGKKEERVGPKLSKSSLNNFARMMMN